MFAEPTEWHTPWMARVLPNVVTIVELDSARTTFTRFIPPESPEDVSGAWQRYYRMWETMTGNRLAAGLVDLAPELGRFVPPAQLEDKPVMSAWHGTLHARPRSASIKTLVVSGCENEGCVLATLMAPLT
jgi:nicotinamidase-related amidase